LKFHFHSDLIPALKQKDGCYDGMVGVSLNMLVYVHMQLRC